MFPALGLNSCISLLKTKSFFIASLPYKEWYSLSMIRVTINLKLMPALLALLGLNSYSWIIVPLTWFSCWVQFAFSTTVTLYRAYLVWYSNFLFFSSFWTHCSLNSERHKIFWILLKKSWSAIFPKILIDVGMAAGSYSYPITRFNGKPARIFTTWPSFPLSFTDHFFNTN